jgi:DNA-binding response OmpR family regulator
MRILIADDEESMVAILKRFLNMKGYEDVDVFFNGTEAMDAVKSGVYDIAFLDEKMPGMSGTAIAGYIKKSGLKTKAVIITGRAETGEAEYLVKPFHLQAVEEVLEKYRK